MRRLSKPCTLRLVKFFTNGFENCLLVRFINYSIFLNNWRVKHPIIAIQFNEHWNYKTLSQWSWMIDLKSRLKNSTSSNKTINVEIFPLFSSVWEPVYLITHCCLRFINNLVHHTTRGFRPSLEESTKHAIVKKSQMYDP